MLAWEIGTRLELGFSKFINWEIQEGPERGEGVLLLISHAFSTRQTLSRCEDYYFLARVETRAPPVRTAAKQGSGEYAKASEGAFAINKN